MPIPTPTAAGALPPEFADSAAYPALHIDFLAAVGKVFEFRREDYLRAAFLDERALGHRPMRAWDVSLAALHAASARRVQPPLPVHWLFHIGHCGSTLVSRLLDAHAALLGLREPLPLLELAMLSVERETPSGRIDADTFAAHLELSLRLLGRGLADSKAVLVKPTSVVLHLAPELLARQARGRAALLSMRLRDWLALMLRSDVLRHGARAQAPVRIAVWHRLSGEHALRIPMLADAELLAMSWLCAQLEWNALAQRMPGRLYRLDFDDFLADVPAGLAGLAAHFGLPDDADAASQAPHEAWLGRYAKDPTQRFDAGTRRREIDAALAAFAPEVQHGLAWARGRVQHLGAAAAAIEPDIV